MIQNITILTSKGNFPSLKSLRSVLTFVGGKYGKCHGGTSHLVSPPVFSRINSLDFLMISLVKL